jgi:hypothetical protein
MSSASLAVSSGEWTRYVSSASTSMDTSFCRRDGMGSGAMEAVGEAGDSQKGFAEASDMREGSGWFFVVVRRCSFYVGRAPPWDASDDKLV